MHLHAQPGKSTASEILHPHLIKLAQLCLHLQVSAGLPPRLVQSKGVGPGVGPAVGAAVGLAVGPADGAFVGMAEGTDVGLAVGPAVGEVVGRDVPPTSATKHTPSAHSAGVARRRCASSPAVAFLYGRWAQLGTIGP